LERYGIALTKAEKAIKYAEYTIDSFTSQEDVENDPYAPDKKISGIVVPAVNELRYAAKHISKIFQSVDSSGLNQEELDKAIRHCVRARYDALHAISLYLIRDFQQFAADYKESDKLRKNIDGFEEHCMLKPF
jgi:hypothetical protein